MTLALHKKIMKIDNNIIYHTIIFGDPSYLLESSKYRKSLPLLHEFQWISKKHLQMKLKD
jgi:hypothetical protein